MTNLEYFVVRNNKGRIVFCSKLETEEGKEQSLREAKERGEWVKSVQLRRNIETYTDGVELFDSRRRSRAEVSPEC